MAYKLMCEYDRIFGAVTAKEFPIHGNGVFCFKVKAVQLKRMLQNMNADMESSIFSLVYSDGARQDAFYLGQSGADAVFLCHEDDKIEERMCIA